MTESRFRLLRGNAVADPTPRQLAYLASLVEKSGMTQDEWRESIGLYEHSPWGKRLRTERVTRSNVSVWIDMLKTKGQQP